MFGEALRGDSLSDDRSQAPGPLPRTQAQELTLVISEKRKSLKINGAIDVKGATFRLLQGLAADRGHHRRLLAMPFPDVFAPAAE